MKSGSAKYEIIKGFDYRFDASYHLSDGIISKKRIINNPYSFELLGRLTDNIFYGGRARRIYVNDREKGVPFVGISHMLVTDFSSVKYISKKHTPNLTDYFVKKGWTLISRSGTIGNTAFVNEDFNGVAASEHIIRLVPNEKIYPGYLYAFMSSKYGYAILTQGSFGAVIQHIEPDFLYDLPIPLFPETQQKEIHNLIVEASELRVKANASLKHATNFFEKKFPISNSYQNIFSKNIKDLGFSWGCKNNDIEIEKVQNVIIKEGSTELREFAEEIFAPPLFKHIYLNKDNGHPFFTGADLIKNYRKKERFLSKRGVRNILDYKVSKGTVLVYKSGPRDGMLGTVIYTDKTLDGSCLSDHVIRIVIKDKKTANWVYAFLKSKIGLRILQNKATGTAILFITPERLSSIPIPKPDNNLDTIDNWVEEYQINFEEAHDKEFRAIQLIEKEIESWQN